jgi:hypothetical protein
LIKASRNNSHCDVARRFGLRVHKVSHARGGSTGKTQTELGTVTLRYRNGNRPAGRVRKLVAGLMVASGVLCAPDCSHGENAAPTLAAAMSYNHYLDSKVPWSTHVVRVPRKGGLFELHSMHAGGKALGLATVTAQTALFDPAGGVPVAALNGDFYERAGAYAGDPRGLHIIQGELISAPSASASFWIDALGEPHADMTVSMLRVIWPGGATSPIGLNGYRQANAIELYTPSLGTSTLTKGGRELVLTQQGIKPVLPLRPGRTDSVRVSGIRDGGDSPLPAGAMILSISPEAMPTVPPVQVGSELAISTATEPNLRGAKTAISGGPILVKNGRRQRIKAPDSESYEFSTMTERHPRSAIGWNTDFFFLVQVDGRYKGVSVGMTLDEFASYLVDLGCQEAVNLDGGGSTTLWYDGKVRNYLCDGYEREVANSLVVLKKTNSPVRRPTPTTENSAKD